MCDLQWKCLPKLVACTAAEFEEFDVKPTIYSYNELRNATRDFHMDMKLGQGAYGAVYKVGLLCTLLLHFYC